MVVLDSSFIFYFFWHFVACHSAFCAFFPQKLSKSSLLMTKTNASSLNPCLREVLIYNREGKRLRSIYEWVSSHRVDAAVVPPRVTHIATDNRCLFLSLPSFSLLFTFKTDDMRPLHLSTSQTKDHCEAKLSSLREERGGLGGAGDFTCRICFLGCFFLPSSLLHWWYFKSCSYARILAEDYSHIIKSGACFTAMKAGCHIPPCC